MKALSVRLSVWVNGNRIYRIAIAIALVLALAITITAHILIVFVFAAAFVSFDLHLARILLLGYLLCCCCCSTSCSLGVGLSCLHCTWLYANSAAQHWLFCSSVALKIIKLRARRFKHKRVKSKWHSCCCCCLLFFAELLITDYVARSIVAYVYLFHTTHAWRLVLLQRQAPKAINLVDFLLETCQRHSLIQGQRAYCINCAFVSNAV